MIMNTQFVLFPSRYSLFELKHASSSRNSLNFAALDILTAGKIWPFPPYVHPKSLGHWWCWYKWSKHQCGDPEWEFIHHWWDWLSCREARPTLSCCRPCQPICTCLWPLQGRQEHIGLIVPCIRCSECTRFYWYSPDIRGSLFFCMFPSWRICVVWRCKASHKYHFGRRGSVRISSTAYWKNKFL